MTTIFLVRHGATEWNRTKRAQGQADIELNEDGVAQAEEIARKLADEKLEAVYSSDSQRAFVTAQAIARPHELEVVVDERLREIDQGEWTGLPVDEIQKRWPHLWGPARHYSPRPGGESPQEVRRRALAALTDVVAAHPTAAVAVVSHGGTIRGLSAAALGYDDKMSARLRGLGNGAAVSMHGALNDGHLVLGSFTRLDGATPDLDDPND